MRKFIWTIVILGVVYLGWKGLGFYRDEQQRKHEYLKMKEELRNDSLEREKDRELQREILKSQRSGDGQNAPQ